MASGSVFSQTLQAVTATKLEELLKQQQAFTSKYNDLLAEVKSENDPLKRLIVLYEGAQSCLGISTKSKGKGANKTSRVMSVGLRNLPLETDLKNLDRFIEQAKFDPSISNEVIGGWHDTLLDYLAVQSAKFEYADLYGKLVTEWLSSESKPQADGDIEMAESFEELPGAKKLEARTEWEKSVFEPGEVDVEAIKNYLQKIFTAEKGANTALKEMRDEVEEFEISLSNSAQFTVPVLKWVIQGLAASDLLSNEKREALKDFLGNDVILNELADVLNMRMMALDRWTWGEFVALEQRRKLSGGWSIHMDAELLNAIFLHYIGTKWSVFFKKAFSKIRKNRDAWKSSHADVPKMDRMRRAYFLGSQASATHTTLATKRNSIHRTQYFAHQLVDHEGQLVEVQEGEEEAEFGSYAQAAPPKRKRALQTARRSTPALVQQHNMQMQRPMAPPSTQSYGLAAPSQVAYLSSSASMPPQPEHGEDDNEEVSTAPKNPMNAKQGLLHVLSTEIIINRSLYGELTCFRTVFESWNPLLPHQSVLAVLGFFGVSERWISFFRRFLQAPLKFIEDGSSSEPRLRQRGTPGSYNLSDMLSETVLFCLDFSVNQATNGALLHRLYDDLWFWNKDYEKCAMAWETVNTFTDIMGVELDPNKTGGMRISSNNDLKLDDRVPEGEIRWGFLALNPSSGRFEIDQKMVDGHIEDFRKQLDSKKSVIDWIQAYNSIFATFFSANFGRAANCFGREHVDKMLATHQHIQKTLFDGGNVVQYLKQTISSRFGVENVPDGFLFFPVELGGLDLKSPFIGLLQIQESVEENPESLLETYQENERDDYKARKDAFDRGEVRYQRYIPENPNWVPEDANTFFSFEEFIRHREEYNGLGKADLRITYMELLKHPSEVPIEPSSKLEEALEQLVSQTNLQSIKANWSLMNAYWQWIVQLYGTDMAKKFGGLNVVDPGLLPIGMVRFFREKRTKWQG